jgi:hypothetical protein
MRVIFPAIAIIGFGYSVNGQQAMPHPHYKLIKGNHMQDIPLPTCETACGSFTVTECPSIKPVSLQHQAGKA